MYYSCHCIKRNGLQHDCRRTGCGGEPACLVLPDPLCAPSQLARARGLADPAPLAAHLRAQAGGGSSGATDSSSGGGKKFIVCELKSIMPDASESQGQGQGHKCCKCPDQSVLHSSTPTSCKPNSGLQVCIYNSAFATPISKVDAAGSSKCPCKKSPPEAVPKMDTNASKCCCKKALPEATPKMDTGGSSKCPCTFTPATLAPKVNTIDSMKCPCSCASALGNMQSTVFVIDEKTVKDISGSFDKKSTPLVRKPGPIDRHAKQPKPKEEPCTRPGCNHWKPPPPCVWDAPCKADCFETPPGIQPGRNPLTGGGGSSVGTSGHSTSPEQKVKLLTPEYCTGCSGNQGASATGGPAAGLPMLVLKLC